MLPSRLWASLPSRKYACSEAERTKASLVRINNSPTLRQGFDSVGAFYQSGEGKHGGEEHQKIRDGKETVRVDVAADESRGKEDG